MSCRTEARVERTGFELPTPPAKSVTSYPDAMIAPIPLIEQCRLGEVSRAGFYRWRVQAPAEDADMELRDATQRLSGPVLQDERTLTSYLDIYIKTSKYG